MLKKTVDYQTTGKTDGCCSATILMYEQNKHPIPYDVANELSKALEVDEGILYNDFADFLAAPYY